MDPEYFILSAIMNQNINQFHAAVVAYPNCNFNYKFEPLNGQTMLHVVTLFPIKFVKLLISKRVDPKILDNESRSPAYLASAYGNIDALILILYEELKADLPNEEYKEKNNHDMMLTMVNYLKESKWNRCNLFTENKPSVLHVACWHGSYNVVEILLSLYAAIPEVSRPSINTQDHENSSPILCCLRGLIKVAKDAQTTNKNKGKPVLEYTPQQTELFRNHMKCLELLENHGARLSTNDSARILNTAVHYNLLDLVEKLISLGVDINLLFDKDDHPLHIAISLKLYDMIELLCGKGGADMHAFLSNNARCSVLGACLAVSSSETLNHVLNHCRTDVLSHVYQDGSSPLLMVVSHYIIKEFFVYSFDFGDNKEREEAAKMEIKTRLDIFKVLLIHKANPFQCIQDGSGSVVDLVIVTHKLDLMKLCMEHTDQEIWNIDTQNVNGWTPLILALFTYFQYTRGPLKDKKTPVDEQIFIPLSMDTAMIDILLQGGADPDLVVTFKTVTSDEDLDLDAETSVAANPFGFKLFSNEKQTATLSANQVLAQMDASCQQELQSVFDKKLNGATAAISEE